MPVYEIDAKRPRIGGGTWVAPSADIVGDEEIGETATDDMEVGVQVLKVGQTSITFDYRVFKKRDPEPRIVGHNVTVCLNMDTFEKMDIPRWFRQLLKN